MQNRVRNLLVFAFLSGFLHAPAHSAPKNVLIIGQGPDGHPAGSHEFMAGAKIVEQLLRPWPGEITTSVHKADEPWSDGPALLDKADGIVLLVTQGAQWMQEATARHDALKRLAARKGAIVALHWSIGAKDERFIPGQLSLLGGTRGGPQRKYVVLENDVKLSGKGHPILRGLSDFRIEDEFYYRLDLVEPSPAFHPLLTTRLENREETICWGWERPDGGRSFGYVGLHFHRNWERPEYRRLVTQGILWTLGMPIPENGVEAKLPPEALKLPAPAAPSGK
jgi:type 1 glutamine amidotransferase